MKKAGMIPAFFLGGDGTYLFTIRAGTESVRIAPSTIDAASMYMPESVLCVASFSQPTA